MQNKQYYIKKAIDISKKSNDPITKVGCILINNDEKIIAKGFNYIVIQYDFNNIDRETRKMLFIYKY